MAIIHYILDEKSMTPPEGIREGYIESDFLPRIGEHITTTKTRTLRTLFLVSDITHKYDPSSGKHIPILTLK